MHQGLWMALLGLVACGGKVVYVAEGQTTSGIDSASVASVSGAGGSGGADAGIGGDGGVGGASQASSSSNGAGGAPDLIAKSCAVTCMALEKACAPESAKLYCSTCEYYLTEAETKGCLTEALALGQCASQSYDSGCAFDSKKCAAQLSACGSCCN